MNIDVSTISQLRKNTFRDESKTQKEDEKESESKVYPNTLKVVVKCMEYVLQKPGDKHGGNMHREGVGENIACAGVYYPRVSEKILGRIFFSIFLVEHKILKIIIRVAFFKSPLAEAKFLVSESYYWPPAFDTLLVVVLGEGIWTSSGACLLHGLVVAIFPQNLAWL